MNNLLVLGLIFFYAPFILNVFVIVYRVDSPYITNYHLLFVMTSACYFLPKGFKKANYSKKDIKSFFIKFFGFLLMIILLILLK